MVSTEPGGPSQPLQHLVLTFPAGSVLDTSAVAQCTASDAEMMLLGDVACPSASKIGGGTISGRTTLAGVDQPLPTFDVVLFNAPGARLLTCRLPGTPIVVNSEHQPIGLDNGCTPACPTITADTKACPTGAQPCLATIGTVTLTTPVDDNRVSYFTTPNVCPDVGVWQSSATFIYIEGFKETVRSTQPCTDD